MHGPTAVSVALPDWIYPRPGFSTEGEGRQRHCPQGVLVRWRRPFLREVLGGWQIKEDPLRGWSSSLRPLELVWHQRRDGDPWSGWERSGTWPLPSLAWSGGNLGNRGGVG